MIAFVYGTTAELIKVAPVYHRIVESGVHPSLWCTGQQLDELPVTHERLSIPEPDLWLARGAHGRSLARPTDVPIWLRSIARNARRERRALEDALWSDGRPPLVLVHGDTMTTVVGSLLGRWLGATVAHIEAGLRSNRLLHPFPEEIDRRLAAVLAHIHYSPGEQSLHNLRRHRGFKLNTGANTVLDALRLVPPDTATGLGPLPDVYGVASLHRFELVQNRERFVGVMERLAKQAVHTPIYVITDPVASAQLAEFSLEHLFDDRLVRVGKLPYFEFVSLLRGASFVVTDSGGLQEECAYLNMPCLVHRMTTERSEGIGTNAVLSGFDLRAVDSFLSDPGRFKSRGEVHLPSPSDAIVSHLETAGFIGRSTGRPTRHQLSVVMPAYRDARTIGAALSGLVHVLSSSALDWEVIVVSDGSDDGTDAVARTSGSDRVRVVHYADNAGKGFAVRYGFAQAKGELVAFIDADDALDPNALLDLVERLQRTGADVAIGSKVHPESDVTYRRLRRLQFGAFRWYVRRLFRLDLGDTQTGCKVFRREVLDEVLPYAHTNGFAFDIELLATANDLGKKIVEGPVRISHAHPAVVRPRIVLSVLFGSLRLARLRRVLRNDLRERAELSRAGSIAAAVAEHG